MLQVTLDIERLYGSRGAVQVQYRIVGVDENGHSDFHHVQYSSLIMRSRQVAARITVQVMEHFIQTMLHIVNYALNTLLPDIFIFVHHNRRIA